MCNTNSEQHLKRILEALGEPPRDIYSPREDSFLLIDALSSMDLTGRELLDMGTGSGILAFYCAMKGAHVTAADIDQDSVNFVAKTSQKLNLEVRTLLTDLFSNIVGEFDTIVFNPPYLDSNEISDRTVDGGRRGKMVIMKFLDALPNFLRRGGHCYILMSSLNEPENVLMEKHNLDSSVVRTKNLFFEQLKVLRLWLREDHPP